MSKYTPQANGKEDVLRLKKLLDTLHTAVQIFLPANATIGQISKTFGVTWTIARRFWVEGISGGPLMINAIKAKVGRDEICDQVLELIERLPDSYKSLVPYKVGAIDLAFDITDAFRRASNQVGVVERNQINMKQFSMFFGQNHDFVHAVLIRNRSLLAFFNEELDFEIRTVLNRTDWTTARPLKGNAKSPPSPKCVQLADIVVRLRPQYPSERAMLRALDVHEETLKNAIEGKARPKIFEKLFHTARKLSVKAESVPATDAGPRVLPTAETFRIKEPQTFVGSFISSLHSFVKMGEAAGLDGQVFTDGNRDSLIAIITKLAVLAKIDEAAIKRLKSTEGLSAGDPGLKAVLSALSGGKR